MYNKKVLDNFTSPSNAGGLQKSNANSKVISEIGGEMVKLYIKINESNNIIEDAHFKSVGNVAVIACSNVACDLLKDKSVEEAKQIKCSDILHVLGELPYDKIYCSRLVEDAITQALKKYEENN